MSEPWTTEEITAIWREVTSESDRGCVLLCGALLDRGLERLLRLKFQASSGAKKDDIDKVLSHTSAKACLVGFAPRARVAYLLGLIDKEISDSLRIFARIRNDYAHNDSMPAVSVDTIQPIVDAMPSNYLAGFKVLMGVPLEVFPEHSEGRRALMSASMLLHVAIKMRRKRLIIQAGLTPEDPEQPLEQP